MTVKLDFPPKILKQTNETCLNKTNRSLVNACFGLSKIKINSEIKTRQHKSEGNSPDHRFRKESGYTNSAYAILLVVKRYLKGQPTS